MAKFCWQSIAQDYVEMITEYGTKYTIISALEFKTTNEEELYKHCEKFCIKYSTQYELHETSGGANVVNLQCSECSHTQPLPVCPDCGHGAYSLGVTEEGKLALYCWKCGRGVLSWKCEKCSQGWYFSQQNMKSLFKAGGCFIATAVYGDYDCPEVLTLRRFRDDRLDSFLLGRLFIQFYYFVSPSISKMISKNEFLKVKVRKLILDPLTRKLKKS